MKFAFKEISWFNVYMKNLSSIIIDKISSKYQKQNSKKIEFWGNSVIFDPNGNAVKKAKLHEQTLICDIDFKKIETARRHWPFFRDRRIDFYKGILKNPKDG